MRDSGVWAGGNALLVLGTAGTEIDIGCVVDESLFSGGLLLTPPNSEIAMARESNQFLKGISLEVPSADLIEFYFGSWLNYFNPPKLPR